MAYIDWWDFIGRANSLPKEVRDSFYKCSMSQKAAEMWLDEAQFASELYYKLYEKSIPVCNETVLPLMEELVNSRKRSMEYWEQEGFSFRLAQYSIRSVKKAIAIKSK